MMLKKTAWFGAIILVAGAAYASVPEQGATTSGLNSQVDSVAAAQALAKADRNQTSNTPACLQTMANIFCPIAGRIPIIRDIAGQFALITGTSCPTGV